MISHPLRNARFYLTLAVASMVLISACDVVDKSGEESLSEAFELRIVTFPDSTIVHSEVVEDVPVVELPLVSSQNAATFQANSLSFRGRDQSEYDPSDLLLNFYVDVDGGLALLPSVSGGGGFMCGFAGDEIVEDFDGIVYTTSLERLQPTARSTLPYLAQWVDCENDYNDVAKEYLDTLRIDPEMSLIPEESTSMVTGLSTETVYGTLGVEVEPRSAEARVRPVVIHNTGNHWYARLLDREIDGVFTGGIHSEGERLYIVLIREPAI